MQEYIAERRYDGGNGDDKTELPDLPPWPEFPDLYETDEPDDLPGSLDVVIKKRPPEWHKDPSIARF